MSYRTGYRQPSRCHRADACDICHIFILRNYKQIAFFPHCGLLIKARTKAILIFVMFKQYISNHPGPESPFPAHVLKKMQ